MTGYTLTLAEVFEQGKEGDCFHFKGHGYLVMLSDVDGKLVLCWCDPLTGKCKEQVATTAKLTKGLFAKYLEGDAPELHTWFRAKVAWHKSCDRPHECGGWYLSKEEYFTKNSKSVVHAWDTMQAPANRHEWVKA